MRWQTVENNKKNQFKKKALFLCFWCFFDFYVFGVF